MFDFEDLEDREEKLVQEEDAAKSDSDVRSSKQTTALAEDNKWYCPTCEEINKAIRTKCNNCGGKKPQANSNSLIQADSLHWSEDIQYCTDYFQKIRHVLHRDPEKADVVKASNRDQFTLEEFLGFEGESLRQHFPIKIRIQQVLERTGRDSLSVVTNPPLSKHAQRKTENEILIEKEQDTENESSIGHSWECLEILSEGLSIEHASASPLDRRAHSWARTIAFSQVALGANGVAMHHGSTREPFVIWIAGARNEIEVSLAARGYFIDTNWVDRAPTSLVIIGDNLEAQSMPLHTTRREQASALKEDGIATYVVSHPRVNVRSKPSLDGEISGCLFRGMEVRGREEGDWIRLDHGSIALTKTQTVSKSKRQDNETCWVLHNGAALGLGLLMTRKTCSTSKGGIAAPEQKAGPRISICTYKELSISPHAYGRPHLVAFLMPNLEQMVDYEEEVIDEQSLGIPENVLQLLDDIPIVVSTRFQPSKLSLRRRLQSKLKLSPVRCPFSAAAGDPGTEYDDNGWVFAFVGAGEMLEVLTIVRPHFQQPELVSNCEKTETLFWGIVDLKYDDRQDILSRIKVLETGDGKISKFSGHGAPIKECIEGRFTVREEGGSLKEYNFIARDKKLTHDLFESTGYAHLVPDQLCFPRTYHEDLADDILSRLGMQALDILVLKLCNRARGAGCLFVYGKDLDAVLKEILTPPEHMGYWLDFQLFDMEVRSAGDTGIERDSYEEQVRHWWSNEGPYFVVERCCASVPIEQHGLAFDGTMRVGFALCDRQQSSSRRSARRCPEDLQVKWLGAYWKLPKCDMSSDFLRERIISAAKTGTAPVESWILTEVCSALEGSLQQLFGAAEITAPRLEEEYKDQPELAKYFNIRSAMSLGNSAASKRLVELQLEIDAMQDTHCRTYVKSYLDRAFGVLALRKGESLVAKESFNNALQHMRTNASAFSLLALAALDAAEPRQAVDFANKTLLLDPDFRSPYAHLGIAYLRLGMVAVRNHDLRGVAITHFERVIEISEVGLKRFEGFTPLIYHSGVAHCQLALLLQNDFNKFVLHRRSALAALTNARSSPTALKRRENLDASRWTCRRCDTRNDLARSRCNCCGDDRRDTTCEERVDRIVPWLETDDKMIEAMSSDLLPLDAIELPVNVGWRYQNYRI